MGGNSVLFKPEFRLSKGKYATELHAFWRAPTTHPLPTTLPLPETLLPIQDDARGSCCSFALRAVR